MGRMLITILFSLSLISCANKSTEWQRQNLLSKHAKPTEEYALVYFIRAPGFKAGGLDIPYIIADKTVNVGSNEYFYAYFPAMDDRLISESGSRNISYSPGQTYYIEFGYFAPTSKILSPKFIDEPITQRLIPTHEGQALIYEYNLVDDYEPLFISLANRPIVKLDEKNKASSQSYTYNESSKKGMVSISGNLTSRGVLVEQIRSICHDKNRALSTGRTIDNSSGMFNTLDERIEASHLIIEFECLY